MSLTEADYNGWRFMWDAMHINGGKAWFGWGHRCIDQPRLLVIDKYIRAERSGKRSYVVDGRLACDTLAEALAALDVPPIVSEADMAVLRTVPTEWARPLNRLEMTPLADKGLVEWGRDGDDKVAVRLTAAGAAALA